MAVKATIQATTQVHLAEWTPRWAEIFREESILLTRILGPAMLQIHHIGSTSVPGLLAKPVVDMLGVVADITCLDAFRQTLADHGYAWNGEYGIPGRRYFDKYSDESPMELVHLHVFAEGSPPIANHLFFRDYLRSHPDTAAEYAALKRQLQQTHPHDRRAYTDAKDPFIKSILARQQAEAF